VLSRAWSFTPVGDRRPDLSCPMIVRTREVPVHLGADGARASAAPSFLTSLRQIGPILIATKIALVAVSWLSIRTAGPGGLQPLFAGRGIPLFAWDSRFYLQILEQGYPGGEQAPYLIAFFPAYPLASWPLLFWIGGPAALLVIANLASLAGYSLFHTWCRRLSDARTALFATLIAISYPPTFFASCAYAEGPFVLATAGVLLMLTEKRLWAAALVAAAASALRPTGVVLAALVAVTALGREGWLPPRFKARALSAAVGLGLVASSGVIVYETFLAVRYHDPMVYFAAQKNWDGPTAGAATPAMTDDATARPAAPLSGPRAPAAPRRLDEKLLSVGAWNKLLALIVLAVSALALVRPRFFPRSLLLVPIGMFLIGYLPGGGARASSVARFLVAALPCFLYLAGAAVKRPRLTYGVLLGCWILQFAFVAAFSRGMWAG
jgi:hypothetical protein